MTTAKTAKTVKSTAFSWDEENTAKAGDLYTQMVEESGIEFANENLKVIAQAVGAKSAAAVRSKLVSAKVYQKADTPRKVGGGSSIRKIHYVRALVKAAEAKGLEVEADALDSLESSKMSALKILADIVGVQVTGE